jgi:phosphatidylinositol kinase/protein kinase (PI-3  family)
MATVPTKRQDSIIRDGIESNSITTENASSVDITKPSNNDKSEYTATSNTEKADKAEYKDKEITQEEIGNGSIRWQD